MTDVLQPPAHSAEPADTVGASHDDAPTGTSLPSEATVPAPPRMTFDEFMAYDPEVGRAEWVDGEVVLVSPASSDHQRIFSFLIALFNVFLGRHPLGEMFSAPFLMRLP